MHVYDFLTDASSNITIMNKQLTNLFMHVHG